MDIVWGQHWFKKNEFKKDVVLKKESAEQIKENKKLYCKFCKLHITDLNKAINVNGAHTQTFSNPSGHVYTINCFLDAPGCKVIGKSTDEYTWFSAYEWQVVICSSCKEQLGWLFSSEDHFYALITDRLTSNP